MGNAWESAGTVEILEEGNGELIAMTMRSRRSEWFEHGNRREETENTVVKIIKAIIY